MLEALACGRPVVASAVGGIPEQVEHGKTGFLVPGGDQQAMAQHVEQLLCNRSRWSEMGHHAAEAARSRFNLERQVNAYLEWYESILNPVSRSQASSAVQSPESHDPLARVLRPTP